MHKTNFFIGLATLFSLIVLAASCSSSGGSSSVSQGKVIKSAPIGNNLTVTLSNRDGILRNGDQEIFLTFTDASGKPVDVGAVSFNNYMPSMGSMPAMNNAAALTTTGTAGLYRGKIDVEMAGEWQSQIAYEGPVGKGKTAFSVTAQ
jgi:hypothetical protein